MYARVCAAPHLFICFLKIIIRYFFFPSKSPVFAQHLFLQRLLSTSCIRFSLSLGRDVLKRSNKWAHSIANSSMPFVRLQFPRAYVARAIFPGTSHQWFTKKALNLFSSSKGCSSSSRTPVCSLPQHDVFVHRISIINIINKYCHITVDGMSWNTS